MAEEQEKQTIARKIEEQERMLRTLPDTWRNMTDVEKQNIIRELVERVVLTSGRMKVVLNKTQYEQIVLNQN